MPLFKRNIEILKYTFSSRVNLPDCRNTLGEVVAAQPGKVLHVRRQPHNLALPTNGHGKQIFLFLSLLLSVSLSLSHTHTLSLTLAIRRHLDRFPTRNTYLQIFFIEDIMPFQLADTPSIWYSVHRDPSSKFYFVRP